MRRWLWVSGRGGLWMGRVGGLAVFLGLSLSASTTQGFSPAEVYRKSAPGVVVVLGSNDGDKKANSGTGTIVSRGGLVLTNHHVVTRSGRKRPLRRIHVFLKPTHLTGQNARDLRTPLLARVLASDAQLDLALLEIVDPPPGLQPIRFGDSEAVTIGAPVAAIGHPGGGGLWTLTTGTISSVRREGRRDVFQTDAAINPGNSGGPLLDANARLIGVNTFVRRVNDRGLPLEGLNYSLRASVASAWLAQQGVVVVHDEIPREGDAADAEAPAPAPRPSSPEAAPAPVPPAWELAPDAAPQTPAPPRAFFGENGESMFGVPNRAFRVDRAMKAAHRRTLEDAARAFNDLDAEFQDPAPEDAHARPR